MKFLRVLILFSLIGSILPKQGTSQDSLLLIQSVELIRRGQQVTVHLLTNGPPVYEVNENLPAKTLVIKFQNARPGILKFDDKSLRRQIFVYFINRRTVGQKMDRDLLPTADQFH